MKFLVLVGTVREGRNTIYPARLLDEILEKKGHDTVFFDLKESPIPNLEKRRMYDDSPPKNVEKLGEALEDVEAIAVVTPEYNHSIPGALKNAIDHFYGEFENLPVSFVTVSAGGFGGVRIHSHLREIFYAVNADPGPALSTSNVNELIEDGEIQDAEYRERMEEFVESSVEHARR